MRNSICLLNNDNDYDYANYRDHVDDNNGYDDDMMMMMTSRAEILIPRLACAPKYATTPREASNALVKRVMSRSMH